MTVNTLTFQWLYELDELEFNIACNFLENLYWEQCTPSRHSDNNWKSWVCNECHRIQRLKSATHRKTPSHTHKNEKPTDKGSHEQQQRKEIQATGTQQKPQTHSQGQQAIDNEFRYDALF